MDSFCAVSAINKLDRNCIYVTLGAAKYNAIKIKRNINDVLGLPKKGVNIVNGNLVLNKTRGGNPVFISIPIGAEITPEALTELNEFVSDTVVPIKNFELNRKFHKIM